VPVSGSVETEHAILCGEKIYDSADRLLLDERPIAVQQQHRRPLRVPTLKVMQPHAVAFKKAADRRIPSASLPGHQPHEHRSKQHRYAK